MNLVKNILKFTIVFHSIVLSNNYYCCCCEKFCDDTTEKFTKKFPFYLWENIGHGTCDIMAKGYLYLLPDCYTANKTLYKNIDRDNLISITKDLTDKICKYTKNTCEDCKALKDYSISKETSIEEIYDWYIKTCFHIDKKHPYNQNADDKLCNIHRHIWGANYVNKSNNYLNKYLGAYVLCRHIAPFISQEQLNLFNFITTNYPIYSESNPQNDQYSNYHLVGVLEYLKLKTISYYDCKVELNNGNKYEIDKPTIFSIDIGSKVRNRNINTWKEHFGVLQQLLQNDLYIAAFKIRISDGHSETWHVKYKKQNGDKYVPAGLLKFHCSPAKNEYTKIKENTFTNTDNIVNLITDYNTTELSDFVFTTKENLQKYSQWYLDPNS